MHGTMTTTRRALPTLALLGLAVIVAVPFSAATPVVATAAPFHSTTQQWAYGAYRSFSLHGSTGAPAAHEYSINAYFGFQVILTETNLSPNVSLVEIQRTMAIGLFEDVCAPSCASARGSANLTLRALEVGTGFANLSTAGRVYEGGHATPALAIANVSDQVSANVSTTGRLSYTTLGGATASASFSVDESANATAAVSFEPALGLFPLTLAAGEQWNSTSQYVSSGGWGWADHVQSTGLNGSSQSLSGSGTGSIAGNGTVYLNGSDDGAASLSDGSTVDALNLTIAGPFSVREGILILPAEADYFGTGVHAPTATNSGTAAFLGTILDVRSHSGSHFGLMASAATMNSNSGYGGTGPVLAPHAMVVSPTDQTGGVRMQAQPESVATAQQWSQCLAGQGSCPGLAGVGPVRTLALLLVVSIVVVGLIASALVVDRRRQTPPAPRPNAALYPTVDARAVQGPPPGAVFPRPPPGPPVPEEPDPLGHLW